MWLDLQGEKEIQRKGPDMSTILAKAGFRLTDQFQMSRIRSEKVKVNADRNGRASDAPLSKVSEYPERTIRSLRQKIQSTSHRIVVACQKDLFPCQDSATDEMA